MPVAKSRLNTASRVGVCVRVSHRNKCGYILTGVEVGCRAVRGGVVPNFSDGMIVSAEPGWIEKNVEVERVFKLIESRYSACVNPGLLECGDLVALLKEESLTPATGMTVRAALEEFVVAKTGDVTEKYLVMVRQAVGRLLTWCPGELLLRDVSASLVAEYDRFLHSVKKQVQVEGKTVACRTAARKAGRTKLSEAQIGKEKGQLKAFFNWCGQNGLAEFKGDLFGRVVIRRSEGRDCAVSGEVIIRLRDAVLEGSMALARDIFLLSWEMGGMNWSDIRMADWRGDVVSFERNKIKGRTKSRMVTRLPVSDGARAILNDRIDRRGRFVTGWKYSDPGDEVRYIGRLLRKLRDLLGLPEQFSFYSARHTFSQMALECGISDVIVNYIQSHSNNGRGVISFYSAVTPKMAGLAMARVRDYMEHPEKYEGEIVAGLLR